MTRKQQRRPRTQMLAWGIPDYSWVEPPPKKKPAATGVPTQSGGTSGDLTVEGHVTQTPVVPYTGPHPAPTSYVGRRTSRPSLASLLPPTVPSAQQGLASLAQPLAAALGAPSGVVGALGLLTGSQRPAESPLEPVLKRATDPTPEVDQGELAKLLIKRARDTMRGISDTDPRAPQMFDRLGAIDSDPLRNAPDAWIRQAEQQLTGGRASTPAEPRGLPIAAAKKRVAELSAAAQQHYHDGGAVAGPEYGAQVEAAQRAQFKKAGLDWSYEDYNWDGTPKTAKARREISQLAARMSGQAGSASGYTGPVGNPNSADPLGPRTPGQTSLEELLRASQNGTLKLGPGGKLTTAPERQALRKLRRAQAAFDRGQGDGSVEANVGSYLRSQGLSRLVTSGILGNAYQESRYDPGAIEPGTDNGGLWGFTAGEVARSEVEKYAAAKGKPWDDEIVQSEFLLEHVDPGTLQKMASASSPEEAAVIFMNEFERPGIPVTETRERAAREAFDNGSWGKPDPQARANLKAAKAQAREQGINPTMFNGDVAGGEGDYTWVRADAKGMVDWVESALGTDEGTAKQQRWADRTGLGYSQPWCANFVSNGLLRRGFSPEELPANPNFSGSSSPGYQAWGEEGRYAKVVKGGIENAKPGDILTFGEGGNRHVGVYVGNGEYTSGNSSDSVNRNPVDGDLWGIIRPKYKGGKVKVADGQMPGSSMESALGGVGGGEAVAAGPGALSAAEPARAAEPAPLVQLLNPLPVGSPTPLAPMAGSPEEPAPITELEALLAGSRRRT